MKATAATGQRLPGSNEQLRRVRSNLLRYGSVALLLLSIIVYLPPYKQAFVGDDYLHLGYIAPFLENPLAALRVLNPVWTDWYYRPLQNFWVLLCRSLFGLNPFGYYFLQALWHAVAASALIALARKLHLPARAAIIALALFAVYSHHHDVVAWISSIAVIMTTTFSLLAVLAYAHYLEITGGNRHLILIAVLAILAILSHEEGILLPIYLLGGRLIIWREKALSGKERTLVAVLIFAALAQGLVHFLRPNSTISLQSQNPSRWLTTLHPLRLADFVLAVPARWLLLNKSEAGLTVYTLVAHQPLPALIVATALLAFLVFAWWRGSRIMRLALLWILPHLAFVYLTLWSQKPDLFAGRHLYSSWAFMALALADTSSRWLNRQNVLRGKRMLLTALALVYALNIAFIGFDQRSWQEHARRVARVESQMKELIPNVTADTAIFAHRFVLLPSFTPYAAAVWYAEPGITGGSLNKMRGEGWLSDRTYLVDYDGDRLYNLLPDLQDRTQSKILWQAPRASILGDASKDGPPATYTLLQPAGPEHARRMAIRVRSPENGWLALAYDLQDNAGRQLATDVLGAPGTVFRVRLVMGDGNEVLAKATTITAEMARIWQPLLVPLSVDGQFARTVILDTRAATEESYWTVPRVVVP